MQSGAFFMCCGAVIFEILIVCSHYHFDAIGKRSWHFLVRHLRQTPGPVGHSRLPALPVAMEGVLLRLPRDDGARQLFRLRLQGHRAPRLAHGPALVATPLARLRRAPSPAPRAASAGKAQRAPPGTGGVLRLRRTHGRLCLRLRRRGQPGRLLPAGPRQDVVSQRLCSQCRTETAAGRTPQKDTAGTDPGKLKFISTNEIFIHEMNNTHYHCELAGNESAAYTQAVSLTLFPMHTLLSPHTSRAFCSRPSPFCLFTLTDHRARFSPPAQAPTGSAT